MKLGLQFKSAVIGSPLEPAAKQLRWMAGAKQRWQHPELWELYLEERRLPLVLSKILSRDAWCVDVGGHLGSFLTLLLTFAPEGRHCVFEASPTKAQWLKRRFPTVEVFSVAVASAPGSAIFQENHKRSGYSRLKNGSPDCGDATTDVLVETTTLDAALGRQRRIDFIKLDIEGAELAALRGATTVIAKHKPTLLFECTPLVVGDDRRALYEFVTQTLGYRIWTFGDFLFEKGPLGPDEFRKCGIYPFTAINFVAAPSSR